MVNDIYVVTYGPAMDARSFPFTAEGLRDAAAFMASEPMSALGNPNRADLDFDGISDDEREAVEDYLAGDPTMVRVRRVSVTVGSARQGFCWGWQLIEAGSGDADVIRGFETRAQAEFDALDHFPEARVV